MSRSRSWNRIAVGLGFAPHKNLGTQLRQLYDRILQPFDIFNRSKEVPSVRQVTNIVNFIFLQVKAFCCDKN